MFPFALRFSFATRAARVKLQLPPSSITGLRAATYNTFTVTELRSLERNDLMDIMLLERDDWHRKMMAVKDRAFEIESRLKDQLLAAEARVTAEKVGLLLNERELQQQLLAAVNKSNATEVRRNEASEARLKSDMELKLIKIRMRELQIALLRSQNRFNLRGIIESIAEQPDHEGTLSADEKVPSAKRGVQARLDWIIDNSPAYNHFREKIIIHRQIRKVDFDRTSHNVYHELSKHFHENRLALDRNADSIIVDMSQDFRKGVFGQAEGSVLESFLHYRHIPYTTILNDVIEQYSPVKPWGNLERTIMPRTYREDLYKKLFEEPRELPQSSDATQADDDEQNNGVRKANSLVTAVSTSPP